MKPLKSEFKQFVDFTDNIADIKINSHIESAYKYVVKPFFEYEEDINIDLGYSIYSLPSTEPSLKPQLMTFYNDYVKEWWILNAYKRFIVNHGLNVTQFGYTKLTDPERTFEPVTDMDRSKILKMLQNDINVCETAMTKHLNSIGWTLDGTEFNNKGCAKRIKHFGINAIGGARKKGCTDCNTGKQVDTSDYFPDDYL